MRKIVQLDDSEYNRIIELANLNEKQIEEKALDLYKSRGVATVEICVRTENDTTSQRVFNCDTDVWYKDYKFFMSERLRDRLGEFINKIVEEKVNRDYKTPVALMLRYAKIVEQIKTVRYIMYMLAMSGWVAFVALMCFK